MDNRLANGKTNEQDLARFCAAGIAVTAALGALAGTAAALRRLRPRRRSTIFGTAWTYDVKTAGGDMLRMLVVNGGCQGASFHGEKWNQLPFAYFRSFDRMFKTGKHVERVLMIGGGGFTYPKHLLTRRPDVSMDVVEPDGRIISIALEELHLDRLIHECGDRIRIIETDGQGWLECTDERYDAIINDAFTGSIPVRPMAAEGFAQLAKKRLAPGGLYLANVVTYPAEGDYSHLTCTVEALGAVFEHVQIIPTTDEEFSSEENFLVIASDTPLAFEDAIDASTFNKD